MKHHKYILIVAIAVAALATPFVVDAAQQLLPACALDKGRCHINDIVQTFVNFMRLLLGFVGSAVLVFFVYGGFVWITSGGSTEKIKKGKDIVVNTVIGLIIVFGSFTLVQFISDSLGAQQFSRVGQPCANSSNKPGFYVTDPANPATDPKCVTSCSEAPLPDAGYECMDVTTESGGNCIPGICGSNDLNWECCQRL